jgi:hypothetical protein
MTTNNPKSVPCSDARVKCQIRACHNQQIQHATVAKCEGAPLQSTAFAYWTLVIPLTCLRWYMLIKYSHFCDADLQHNCEFDRQQSSYHCVYMGFVSPSMDFVIYPTIRPQYAAMRFGAETTLTSETCRCRLVEGNARDSRMVDSLQGAFHFTHQQSSPAHRVSATTALPPSAFLRRHLQGYRSWNPGDC